MRGEMCHPPYSSIRVCDPRELKGGIIDVSGVNGLIEFSDNKKCREMGWSYE